MAGTNVEPYMGETENEKDEDGGIGSCHSRNHNQQVSQGGCQVNQVANSEYFSFSKQERDQQIQYQSTKIGSAGQKNLCSKDPNYSERSHNSSLGFSDTNNNLQVTLK